jgi:serine protease AprX
MGSEVQRLRRRGRERESRANVLWGGGERRLALITAVVSLLLFALLGGRLGGADAAPREAYISPSLKAEAQARPDALFDVIVQARKGKRADDVLGDIERTTKEAPANGAALGRKFLSIEGASATLTGAQIMRLAKRGNIESITRDSKVELTSFSSSQLWPQASSVTTSWLTLPSWYDYPAIAVVDSGVTSSLPIFSAGQVIASVNLMSTSGTTGAYGHGSMVASIAAGSATGYAGAEPRAKIVSIKVLDGAGRGTKSDIIAACDWILRNRHAFNIRVANFSLNAAGESFRYDPLARATEALWLNGVTVVVAAGNYAVNGERSDVGFAPANNPFVITVGASDVRGTPSTADDKAAPWSAWGYTQDGFFKPELAAPGRYMVGSVPSGANLASQYPERIVAPNYMWMSGTSFAAPVVSGIAASLLAKNPTWTPDQVKGALMASVDVPAQYGSNGALGVGVVNAARALAVSNPPNPNAGLNQFVAWNNATRRYEFDASAWYGVASTNPSWNAASWSSASWANASWSSASWANASWSSASWANASWANSTDVE